MISSPAWDSAPGKDVRSGGVLREIVKCFAALAVALGKDAIRILLKTLEVRTGKRVEYEDEEAKKVGNKWSKHARPAAGLVFFATETQRFQVSGFSIQRSAF